MGVIDAAGQMTDIEEDLDLEAEAEMITADRKEKGMIRDLDQDPEIEAEIGAGKMIEVKVEVDQMIEEGEEHPLIRLGNERIVKDNFH